MRTIRLNAYGTHKKAYRTLFLGSLEWYGTRTMRQFFEKCRRDAYQGPQIEARTEKRTNTEHKRPNSGIPDNLSQFYCFFPEHAGAYSATSATSATAKIKWNLWGASAKAMRSPREALFA
jgi:hypothetical protein